MRIERETVLIVVLIGLVLAPMWYFALASGEPTAGVQLQSDDDTAIAPTETFIPTPTEINSNVSGVVTWVALFVLVAMIVYTRRFTERVGHVPEAIRPDGGSALPSWLIADHRQVLAYWPAKAPSVGLATLAILTWTVVAFAALLAWEGLNYARTQFLGIYMGMMLLSMGIWMAVYITWFIPSITVAEQREH